jgi:hypothetical protein
LQGHLLFLFFTSVFSDDFVLDLHHRKVEFYFSFRGAGAEVVPHHLGQQAARSLEQRPGLSIY